MPTDPMQPGQIVEAPRPIPAPPSVRAPGGIVIARHAEPALSRKVKLSARQYRDWWALYEAGGILTDQQPPAHLKDAAEAAGLVYTSTRLRSIETAKVLVGARDMTHDALFIEAPLPPPPLPDWLKLSPRQWGVVSRLCWWLGAHGGEETRREAQRRSAEAAKVLHELASRGDNVLLVAHGFFNSMIGLELRKLGWKCVKGRGYRYWSTRYFERP